MDADIRHKEFVAMLAHELRNPLTPILNAVPILRRLGNDDDRLCRVVDIVQRNVEVMARLIEDLLDVSRITSGKIVLRKEVVSFQAVVRNAVDAVNEFVAQKGHDITISVPDETVVLIGDTIRLEQVFFNLIHNAAKYTPDGGVIKIDVGITDKDVQTVVSDTGIGIEPADQKVIWDVFSQAYQPLDRPQGGLGLGLTVVKKLVELHGGSVRVESSGTNQGCRFTVTLPRLGVKMANNTSPSKAGVAHADGLKILLVDDNKDATESLRMYLEMCGHSVTVVYDGKKAIDAAQEKEYQVILLDIGLPGASGFEVCETLRKSGCKSYIIAVTGYGQDEDKERCKQVGFDRHLTKPVNPDLIEEYLLVLSN